VKLVVLHQRVSEDATQDEQDVLVQVAAVTQSLRRLGHAVRVVECSLNLGVLEQQLRSEAPDVVFNLVEALGVHSRMALAVVLLLESLAVPFTGSGFVALTESTNKLLTKRRLMDVGIPTPRLFDASCNGRYIVKSVWEHASLGIDADSVVESAAVCSTIENKRARFGGEFFAERYIDGRELNVAVCATSSGPLVLPVAEIDFLDLPRGLPHIVDYAAKWLPDSVEYRGTQRRFLTREELDRFGTRASDVALMCYRAFDLRGYARVDLRLAEDEPYVVDVNANPCLSPDAGFTAALVEAGLDFDWAVAQILAEASGRRA
jgi:D-alanine-D-alanine ligase